MKNCILLIASVLAFFAISSCSKDDDEFGYGSYYEDCQQYLVDNAQRDGVTVTSSGLQYEVLREGAEDGKSPVLSSSVRCHYKGMFINGQVFDSSYGAKEPVVFPLRGVIAGWTEGLQYMKEGAIYRFVIPYQLGYGPYGYASIPAYSTLIFEVELIEVL